MWSEIVTGSCLLSHFSLGHHYMVLKEQVVLLFVPGSWPVGIHSRSACFCLLHLFSSFRNKLVAPELFCRCSEVDSALLAQKMYLSKELKKSFKKGTNKILVLLFYFCVLLVMRYPITNGRLNHGFTSSATQRERPLFTSLLALRCVQTEHNECDLLMSSATNSLSYSTGSYFLH